MNDFLRRLGLPIAPSGPDPIRVPQAQDLLSHPQLDPKTGRPVPPYWDPAVPDWSPYQPKAYDQEVDRVTGRSATKALLDRIALGEGTGDERAKAAGFDSGYDVPIGYGKFGVPDKPLSQMTLDEVDAFQKEMHKSPDNPQGHTPVGRYQIRMKTLKELRDQLGLRGDEIFDKSLQDRLGQTILNNAGMEKYRQGLMSLDAFQNKIAGLWASVANASGKAKQNLGTTSEEIQAAISPLYLHP